MSEQASKNRLDNSRETPDFWWFHGKDLAGFFKEVGEQGVENVRIVITPGLDEQGKPDLHLRVVPEGRDMRARNGDGYNVSHPCPPDCGGG